MWKLCDALEDCPSKEVVPDRLINKCCLSVDISEILGKKAPCSKSAGFKAGICSTSDVFDSGPPGVGVPPNPNAKELLLESLG